MFGARIEECQFCTPERFLQKLRKSRYFEIGRNVFMVVRHVPRGRVLTSDTETDTVHDSFRPPVIPFRIHCGAWFCLCSQRLAIHLSDRFHGPRRQSFIHHGRGEHQTGKTARHIVKTWHDRVKEELWHSGFVLGHEKSDGHQWILEKAKAT